jgi:hypothetical protein
MFFLLLKNKEVWIIHLDKLYYSRPVPGNRILLFKKKIVLPVHPRCFKNLTGYVPVPVWVKLLYTLYIIFMYHVPQTGDVMYVHRCTQVHTTCSTQSSRSVNESVRESLLFSFEICWTTYM